MAEFLSTKGVVYRLDSLISNANKELILVSPFLYLPKSLVPKINAASRREVRISIVFGARDLRDYEEERLNDLQSFDLYFCPRLHAKAYLNEHEAIVTSFNLSQYAEVNNIEFGVYFTKKEIDLYGPLAKEVASVFEESHLCNQSAGHCIRCGVEIEMDPSRPLCLSCYSIWKEFRNVKYLEKYCHVCGRNSSVSFQNPICKNH